MNKKKIFRSVSLERLSSPEQLDQLMQVTTPKGWIALIAIGGLIVMAVIWGFVGSVPTKVQGQGILIKSGGIFDIVPIGGGRVTDIAVRVGDVVQEGQVVARIAQPDRLDAIRKARTRLEEAEAQYHRLIRFGDEDLRLQSDYLREQRVDLETAIDVAEEQRGWFEEQLANQEQLLAQGLITKQTLLGTKQQIFNAQSEIESAQNRLRQVAIQELEFENTNKERLLGSRSQIAEARSEVERLEDELELRSKVVSPHTGRILEVMVEDGSMVAQGTPVMRLDLMGKQIKDLEVVLYVPSMEGKKLSPGMQVRVAPTTVRREEYGFMIGNVTYVSEFPATRAGMMRVLKNEQLVQTLSGMGAPFEVYADLRVDPSTLSGYTWTSSDGPPLDIQSGTLCMATVTVLTQRPVELIIPKIREYLGI